MTLHQIAGASSHRSIDATHCACVGLHCSTGHAAIVVLSATNVSGKERGNGKCRREETENNSRLGEVRKKLYWPGSGARWTGEVGFRPGLNAVAKRRSLGRTWNRTLVVLRP